jgi:hypothetical protein
MELFNKFNILPLASKFQLSLLSFVVYNMEKLQTISDMHSISTRYRCNLHVPSTNLGKYQKRVYCSGVTLFSKIPPNHKFKLWYKKFKPALEEYISNISSFAFQIFPFLVPEMSTSFPPYITQVIFIHYTWVLQPL